MNKEQAIHILRRLHSEQVTRMVENPIDSALNDIVKNQVKALEIALASMGEPLSPELVWERRVAAGEFKSQQLKVRIFSKYQISSTAQSLADFARSKGVGCYIHELCNSKLNHSLSSALLVFDGTAAKNRNMVEYLKSHVDGAQIEIEGEKPQTVRAYKCDAYELVQGIRLYQLILSAKSEELDNCNENTIWVGAPSDEAAQAWLNRVKDQPIKGFVPPHGEIMQIHHGNTYDPDRFSEYGVDLMVDEQGQPIKMADWMENYAAVNEQG